jgi:hypothetical protein
VSVVALSRNIVTTVADLVGSAAVAVGVAFIYWPAGVIVAGLGVLFASYNAAAPSAAGKVDA